MTCLSMHPPSQHGHPSTSSAWRVGGSTGTNLWACAKLAGEMAAAGETGSIVTLLCDGGERYAATYYDDAWLAAKGLDWQPAAARIAAFLGAA